MRSINFFSLLLILSAIVFLPVTTKAQVTIGSAATPQEFSVLELIVSDPENQPQGFRLPQLDIFQRYAISDAHGSEPEMMGLQVFDTFTRCVHTWNGSIWLANCYGGAEPPGLPESVSPPTGCGITSSENNTVFTALVDPNAVMHEFFVNGISQGVQQSHILTLPEPVENEAVTVEYLFPESFLRPSFAERMVRVDGGTFGYGAALQTPYNAGNPVPGTFTGTTTTVSTFYLARTPVTQAQFEAVMGVNPALYICGGPRVGDDITSASPVERVSWYDAVAFANRLSALEGRDIFYQVTVAATGNLLDRDFWLTLDYSDIPVATGDWTVAFPSNPRTNNGYRLPTEAEWEFAARGGILRPSAPGNTINPNERDYFFSNGNNGNNVWHNGNSGNRTHPVGQFNSNALGLYDMSGNVWEWTWNWFGTAGSGAGGTDPVGPPDGSNRLIRGGGWGNLAAALHVSSIRGNLPAPGRDDLGFRLAASAP